MRVCVCVFAYHACVAPCVCLRVGVCECTNQSPSPQYKTAPRQLLDEFLSAVRRRYGNTTLIHFEDMRHDNAAKLLNMYRTDFPCYSDDLQARLPFSRDSFRRPLERVCA